MLGIWRDPMFGLFDDVMTSAFASPWASSALTAETTDDGVRFEVDLPGVKAEDLDVEVENGVLTVRGERKGNASRKFTHSIAVPAWAEVDKLEARLEDGVLSVSIPKRESAKPRKIQLVGAKQESKQLGEGDED